MPLLRWWWGREWEVRKIGNVNICFISTSSILVYYYSAVASARKRMLNLMREQLLMVSRWVSEWVSKWMIEWMSEWMIDRVSELKSERVSGWMNESVSEQQPVSWSVNQFVVNPSDISIYSISRSVGESVRRSALSGPELNIHHMYFTVGWVSYQR